MTDLTDRMRTTAAALAAADLTAYRIYENVEADRAVKDAVDLLIEASNALEACMATGAACIPLTDAEHQLGQPISTLVQDMPPPTPEQLAKLAAWEASVAEGVAKQKAEPPPNYGVGQWIDGSVHLPVANPTRGLRACPQCDSRAAKRVDRQGRILMLTCPVCGERWEWRPHAEWR